MHLFQFDIAHIRRVVVILDLPAGPVIGLDPEVVARFNPDRHRNIRMPAVMDLFVGMRGLAQI